MKKEIKEIFEYIEENKHSFVNDFELTKMKKFVKNMTIEECDHIWDNYHYDLRCTKCGKVTNKFA